MTHVDLFSGIGGFALAAQANGLKTVCFCEVDKRCQEFLGRATSDLVHDALVRYLGMEGVPLDNIYGTDNITSTEKGTV